MNALVDMVNRMVKSMALTTCSSTVARGEELVPRGTWGPSEARKSATWDPWWVVALSPVKQRCKSRRGEKGPM